MPLCHAFLVNPRLSFSSLDSTPPSNYKETQLFIVSSLNGWFYFPLRVQFQGLLRHFFVLVSAPIILYLITSLDCEAQNINNGFNEWQ